MAGWGRGASRWVAATSLLVAGGLLAACSAARPRSDAAASSGPVRFAVPISLTGTQESEGHLTLDGYKLCQQAVNASGGILLRGRRQPLQLVVSDDASSPERSAAIASGASHDGIGLLLGPYDSATTAAVAAVAERDHQVLADSSGADDTLFDHGYRWVFGVEAPASQYAATIIQALVGEADPTPRAVAFVSADDSFSREVLRYGIARAEKAGMHVDPPISFPAGSTDLSSVVTALRSEHPDVVVESGHLVEGVALLQAAAQLGLRPEAFGETVAPTDPQFAKVLGPLSEGVLGSTQWVPELTDTGPVFGSAEDFAARFRDAFGFTPDYHSAEGSAACLALVTAVEHAGSTDPDAVRSAMATLDTPSFFGPLRFDAQGEDVYRRMEVVQILDGHPVTVWPPALAERPIRWPGLPEAP